MRALARTLVDVLNLDGVGRWLVLGILIGVVAGVGAIVFDLACDAAGHLFLDRTAGYRPTAPNGEHSSFDDTTTPFRAWLLPLTATVGGLLSGLVVWFFAREAGGHGTDSAIDAYHNREGRVSARVPLVKTIASALTIGSGGSGGREGPIAQIGAGFGAFLADRLGLSARERRVLLAAGMGAGVGSIFHAPLAGALFAAEILYSDAEFEADVLIPAAVSTIIGYCVFSLHTGFEPLFATPHLAFTSPWELLPYTLLALLVTLGAGLFVLVFYGVHDWCERNPLPGWLKPMLGGAVTGTIGLGLFVWLDDVRVLDVLSFGYGTLQESMFGTVGVGVLLVIALGKMITTSVSIGSGGSGGVFGPSMVIGGCLGGVVGVLGQRLWPEVVTQPGAYVVVGMAGFFTAAGKVPISTLVMASEMTGTHKLLVPALWVCALAFLFGRRWNLYRSQVPNRLASGAHRHELVVDLLADQRVRDLMARIPDAERTFETVRETDSLDHIVAVFARTTQLYFPVVDGDGRMTGILSAGDVRQVVDERSVGPVVIANDIARPEVVTLTPDDALAEALEKFVTLDVAALPVVDPDDATRVEAMLSRRELIHAYNAAREQWFADRNEPS